MALTARINRVHGLNARVRAIFPARVLAGDGMTITKDGAVYTFTLNYADFAELLSVSAGDIDNLLFPVWNEDTETFRNISLEALLTNFTAAIVSGDLAALEALSGAGIAVRTAADTWALRTLAAPAAGFTISNPAGTAGNPTFVLANDLAALEALSSTGFAARTTTDTWAQRTLTEPAAGLTIANPAGIAGNPTFALANDLAALEALSSTGIAVRTGSDSWAQRSIATATGLTVSNGSGAGGNPTINYDINALTQDAAPDGAADYVVTWDASASTHKKVLIGDVGSAGSVSSLNGQTGALLLRSVPGGRLTLTSGTPVLTATVSAATTIYYALYLHDQVPIYDGTRFVQTTITELSQATTDSTKSPAAVANNSNYDLFVWSDSGTIRCTRGPAWSSDTARGTGAGTTELERVLGTLVNKVNITNGPNAQRGTYVGTVRSNGSAQIDFIYGAIASGGTAGFFGLWNAYNRVDVATFVGDSTDSWTYDSTTPRAANSSTTMRVSMIRGLNEDSILASYHSMVSGINTNGYVGIGLDSTSTFSGIRAGGGAATTLIPPSGHYVGLPGLGFRYAQALEACQSATTETFYGDVGGSIAQSGMFVTLRA